MVLLETAHDAHVSRRETGDTVPIGQALVALRAVETKRRQNQQRNVTMTNEPNYLGGIRHKVPQDLDVQDADMLRSLLASVPADDVCAMVARAMADRNDWSNAGLERVRVIVADIQWARTPPVTRSN